LTLLHDRPNAQAGPGVPDNFFVSGLVRILPCATHSGPCVSGQVRAAAKEPSCMATDIPAFLATPMYPRPEPPVLAALVPVAEDSPAAPIGDSAHAGTQPDPLAQRECSQMSRTHRVQ
jgi:hypothetical protein